MVTKETNHWLLDKKESAKRSCICDVYRLDFRCSLASGLPSPRSSGAERGLLSRTAAGNRAYDV